MDSQILMTVGADCDGAVHSKDLLGELWQHLKTLEMEESECVRTAWTPRQWDNHYGARHAIRELQNWMLSHGYSPNVRVSESARENPTT